MAERSGTKVRVGVGLGVQTSTDPGRLVQLVECLEALGFDSLWFSERMSAGPDPFAAIAYAAARSDRLKFGTAVTILPGRNPMLLAKELGTLDQLSRGRILPAFGLGVTNRADHLGAGTSRDDRSARFDEMLPLVRRFLTEDSVDHKGKFFRYEKARVEPKPVQKSMDLWLGGVAKTELQRCGKLGDGWLPSFAPPDVVAAGIKEIEQAAEKAKRKIDADHFGALVPYVEGTDIPDRLIEVARKRQPGVEPTDVVAQGLKGLRPLLERFVEAGASKFVVVPVVEPRNWDDHIAELADAVQALEN